jgi:hypothetical protein
MNSKIKFDEATHTYTANGIEIPSVTRILQDSKICDYGNMDKKFRDFAMKRGRYVHKATDLYDENTLDIDSIDPQIAGYVQGYIKFRTELQWRLVCKEEAVYNSKDKYAGTLDRVFMPRQSERLIMLDIKTSESAPNWLGLQLSAYIEAKKYDDIPMNISEAVGLLLKNDGTYKLTSVFTRKQLSDMYKVFKAAMVVAKFNGRKKHD